MPFVAKKGGEYVGPYDVEDGETVRCPSCGGEMGVRSTHRQGSKIISRHFFHKSDTDCDGESAAHVKLKTIAKSTMDRRFPDATVQLEQGVGDRIADVLVEFPEPRFPYGNGIIVEAQVKHKDKDFSSVFAEYGREGYSVLVSYLGDISGSELKIVSDRFHTVWPEAVPYSSNWSGVDPHFEAVFGTNGEQSRELNVILPFEYYRFRKPELLSPRVLENTEWEYVTEVAFQSLGNEKAKWDVWVHPEGVARLELWQEDLNSDENARFQTIAVLREDISGLRSVFEKVAEMDGGDLFQTKPHWRTIATTDLTGGQGVSGWLTLGKPANGPVMWVLGRKDSRGNTSTMGVEYRKGDEKRLEPLVNALNASL